MKAKDGVRKDREDEKEEVRKSPRRWGGGERCRRAQKEFEGRRGRREETLHILPK